MNFTPINDARERVLFDSYASANRRDDLKKAREELARVRLDIELHEGATAQPESVPAWVARKRRVLVELTAKRDGLPLGDERCAVEVRLTAVTTALQGYHAGQYDERHDRDPDPRLTRLLSREAGLEALVEHAEAAVAAADREWERENARQLAETHEREARDAFEREEAAGREARFAEFKRRSREG